MMKWGRTHKGKSQYMGFNPSGITSEQIKTREQTFVNEMKQKSIEERKAYWNKVKEMLEDWQGSWAWQWCVFERQFVYQNEVYMPAQEARKPELKGFQIELFN